MPDDSIMDMVNNIEPLYNDKNGLYRKWIDMGKDDWDEADARKEARALAAHFAEAIESIPYIRGKYSTKDINDAAEEMIEEFKNEEMPKWDSGSSMGDVATNRPWRVKVRLPTGHSGPQGPIWKTVYVNTFAPSDLDARGIAQEKYPRGIITGSWIVKEGFNPSEWNG